MSELLCIYLPMRGICCTINTTHSIWRFIYMCAFAQEGFTTSICWHQASYIVNDCLRGHCGFLLNFRVYCVQIIMRRGLYLEFGISNYLRSNNCEVSIICLKLINGAWFFIHLQIWTVNLLRKCISKYQIQNTIDQCINSNWFGFY